MMNEEKIEYELSKLKSQMLPSRALLTRILNEIPEASVTAEPTDRIYSEKKGGFFASRLRFFGAILAAPALAALIFFLGEAKLAEPLDLDTEVWAMELDNLEFEAEIDDTEWMIMEDQLSLDLLEIDMVL